MKEMLGDVRFTSPERVMYPSLGVTKLQVAQYYIHAAPWMLPHLIGRPLSVVRCPRGCRDPENPCFFQKHAMKGLHESVLRIQAPTVSGKDTQLSVQDVNGLIALVQFGALEFHVWGSRYDMPENPDRIIIDLDPAEDLRWARVVAAAFWIRKELTKRGLETFVKTTGGKGLHLVIPIERRSSWEQAQQLCGELCERLVAASPTQFTTQMAKSARKGKILLDCLRNARGATAVAPYSTRAREGGTVATPVTWKELESLPRGVFNIPTVIQRIHELQSGQRLDPWAELAQVRQRLSRRNLR